MGRKDSFSFEIDGLREQIENHRSDRAWQLLSMAQRVRLLLEEKLEEDRDWELIRAFIRALAQGNPEEFSITEMAETLDIEPEVLEKLWSLRNGQQTHHH